MIRTSILRPGRAAITAITAGALGFFVPIAALASSGESEGGHVGEYAKALAFLGIIVVLAKIAGAVAERYKQVSVLGNLDVLLAALALTLAAVVGKIVSGFVAGKGADWKVVGLGMVPRGEVGLIFAAIGRQMGVMNDEAFAVVVVMIILTTFVTPIVLPRLIRREQA